MSNDARDYFTVTPTGTSNRLFTVNAEPATMLLSPTMDERLTVNQTATTWRFHHDTDVEFSTGGASTTTVTIPAGTYAVEYQDDRTVLRRTGDAE